MGFDVPMKGGFNFDLCKRNEILVNKGLETSSFFKTGTTIVGLVYLVACMLTGRRDRELVEGINKRLSRKMDKKMKKSIVVRLPPSLKKIQEEEAAEEVKEAAAAAASASS